MLSPILSSNNSLWNINFILDQDEHEHEQEEDNEENLPDGNNPQQEDDVLQDEENLSTAECF
jgi:hypothetical protein